MTEDASPAIAVVWLGIVASIAVAPAMGCMADAALAESGATTESPRPDARPVQGRPRRVVAQRPGDAQSGDTRQRAP